MKPRFVCRWPKCSCPDGSLPASLPWHSWRRSLLRGRPKQCRRHHPRQRRTQKRPRQQLLPTPSRARAKLPRQNRISRESPRSQARMPSKTSWRRNTTSLEKAFSRMAELVATTDPKQAALLRQAFAESRSAIDRRSIQRSSSNNWPKTSFLPPPRARCRCRPI